MLSTALDLFFYYLILNIVIAVIAAAVTDYSHTKAI
jgi:hypothetical protein